MHMYIIFYVHSMLDSVCSSTCTCKVCCKYLTNTTMWFLCKHVVTYTSSSQCSDVCIIKPHIKHCIPLWWLDRLFFCMCKLWNISLCFSQFVFTTRALKLFSLFFFCPLTHVHTCTRLCDVWWNYTVYIPYGDLSGYFFCTCKLRIWTSLMFLSVFHYKSTQAIIFLSINTCMYSITKCDETSYGVYVI